MLFSEHNVALEFFSDNNLLCIFGLFMATFALTYYLIPKVLWVSREKNLMADVNHRSSHSTAIPNFAGVAFYITLVLVLSFLQNLRLTYLGNQLIAASTILFMVGLKDDLVVSTARVKLLGQIFAASFLVFATDLQITSLHGFLGIGEIPLAVGFLIGSFLILGLINAYNLLDGIDGLASIIAISISLIFAIVFYLAEEPYFVLVSVILAGILCAYLRFNFSRGRKKIFMGDSGSLVVGLVLSFLCLKFLAMDPHNYFTERGLTPDRRLLFLACVLFVPVFDTLRVIIIRKMNGKRFFEPDRNHIHHVLLDLGLSHKKASIALGILNLAIVGIYVFFGNKVNTVTILLIVIGIYAATFFVFAKLKMTLPKERG